MATSIGVHESTRDALERVKRELHAPSLDAAIRTVLDEHTSLKGREPSVRLLAALLGHRAEVARFAKRQGIRSLALFGSALHGEARPGSDLDLLATFEPKRTPGLIRLGALERELSSLLGVRVDLQTPGSLSRHFRKEVLGEAVAVYGPA